MYKFMFTFTVCAVLCYAHAQDVTKEHLNAVANECKEESGASDEDIEALMKHEIAESTEAKCLRACIMKKMNVMNDDGKMEKEGILAIVKSIANNDAEKETIGAEIVDICMNLEVSEDHCEAAGEYEKCIKEHASEKGLIHHN